MTTLKLRTHTMTPVAIEGKRGLWVTPIWDRRPRSLRTIRLLAGCAKVDTMIMVKLDGSKSLLEFESKEQYEQ